MPKLGLSLGLPTTKISSAPAFSPTDIAGLKLWLKADAGVTESGGSVISWADQSGQGNNATASGTPTLVANSLNGKSGISLDGQGTDDGFLIGAIFSIGYDTPYSIFGVAKASDSDVKGTQNTARWLLNRGTSNDFATGFTFGEYDGDNYFGGLIGGAGAGDTNLSSEILGENESAVNSLISDGSTASFYKNGTFKESGNTNTWDGTNAINNGFSVGFQNYAGGKYFQSKCIVYEILIYNSSLSTASRQSVESYLNGRYEIY